MTTTPANESHITQAHTLLHGQEQVAYGDVGYTGVDKRPETAGSKLEWWVAEKRGKLRAMPAGEMTDACKHLEYPKARRKDERRSSRSARV